MMIHSERDWKSLLQIVLSWIIVAVVVVCGALAALSILSFFVGKDNFPSLTVLVSVIGALIAISSFRTTAQEKKQSRARTLAFANQMAIEATKALWEPLPAGFVGDVDAAFVLEPHVIERRKPHLQEMAKSIASLDVKEMPSVEAMAALVELKSSMKVLAELIETAPESSVDFDDVVARLVLSSQRLGKERDNLYPTYNLGFGLLQTNVERR